MENVQHCNECGEEIEYSEETPFMELNQISPSINESWVFCNSGCLTDFIQDSKDD